MRLAAATADESRARRCRGLPLAVRENERVNVAAVIGQGRSTAASCPRTFLTDVIVKFYGKADFFAAPSFRVNNPDQRRNTRVR